MKSTFFFIVILNLFAAESACSQGNVRFSQILNRRSSATRGILKENPASGHGTFNNLNFDNQNPRLSSHNGDFLKRRRHYGNNCKKERSPHLRAANPRANEPCYALPCNCKRHRTTSSSPKT